MADATNELIDRMQLAELVGGFAFRNQQRWKELAGLFMPGAPLSISWFRGSVEDFIQASREQARSGKIAVKHHLGRPQLTVNGDRALGETDVTILIRAPDGPDDVLVDVTSFARFSDNAAKTSKILLNFRNAKETRHSSFTSRSNSKRWPALLKKLFPAFTITTLRHSRQYLKTNLGYVSTAC